MAVTVTFVGSGDAFGSGGRFQTCILVDTEGFRFAIDFGASSLVALNKLDIDHNSIDAIVFTHIHGDHCGGIPFLLMDAMLAAKRSRPLVIAGPRDTKARIAGVCEALLPGMHVMKPKFELEYLEMEIGKRHDVGPIAVTPYAAVHTEATNPTSLRFELEGKIISYTGDTAWNDNIPKVAGGADLLVCECYYYEKPIRFHMNYPDIKAHWNDFGAKRIVLTHLSREMIQYKDRIPEQCAYDGLRISL
jgi:ribonuclease BN (tRNA processing enzyme)